MKRITILLCMLVVLGTSISQTITWKKMADLPKGFRGGEAVSLNNKVYFFSGRGRFKASKSFYQFEPSANSWTKLANIPKPTTNLALAAVKGKIYAIGGDKFLNVNHVYTPETDSWEALAPMPTARQHIDCGRYGENIYIIGGLTSWKKISMKNEVFNTETNSWAEMAAIPSLKNNPAIVTLDSLIYVIGGGGSETDIWAETARVDCYNCNSNTWERKADLPFTIFKPGAVVIEDNIIVLGGFANIDSVNETAEEVFIYNTKTDTWQESTPMPIKNIFFGCTAIGNKIYVIGGTPGGHPDWKLYTTVFEGVFSRDEQ
ncbi:hypothetical protein KAR48_19170 [bacterium]|nr:hypothetical protein [bacterium]